MVIKSIREFNRAVPFVPHEVHMASGETYEVPHPDFASISLRGSYMIIIDAEERPHHLNALLIDRASPLNDQATQEPQAQSEIIQRESMLAFAAGISNPSICFLISFANAAAPAPFTTR